MREILRQVFRKLHRAQPKRPALGQTVDTALQTTFGGEIAALPDRHIECHPRLLPSRLDPSAERHGAGVIHFPVQPYLIAGINPGSAVLLRQHVVSFVHRVHIPGVDILKTAHTAADPDQSILVSVSKLRHDCLCEWHGVFLRSNKLTVL